MSLTAAYGGPNWSPRHQSFRDEMVEQWGNWGSSSEYGRLRAVLLRRPGPELESIEDFDAVQMRADLNPTGADRMRFEYENAGVECVEVEVSELIKAGGGIHCMTGFLRRVLDLIGLELQCVQPLSAFAFLLVETL